jgi:putative nucleotidyltransferase with HDIG domain
MFKKRLKKENKTVGKKNYKWDYTLLFLLIVAFATFFHFREKRFAVYELNSIAPKDIIATQDFSYMDKKKMLVLKQEALVDLGRILQIKESDLEHVEENFLLYLSNHPLWRDSYPVTYNEMKKLSEKVIKKLSIWHFTDRRTYKKREELHLSNQYYSVIDSGFEKKAITLPNDFWTKIYQEIIAKNPKFIKEVEFIISMFRANKYIMERDQEERLSMEKSIYQTVPNVYAERLKNDVIVKKGDKITDKEYDQIVALKKAIQSNRNLFSLSKIISSILMSVLVITIGWLYCYRRNSFVLEKTNKLTLYVILILITLSFAKLAEFVLYISPYFISSYFKYPVIIPFISVLLALFLNEGIALFTTFYLSIIVGFSLSIDHSHFIILNILGGIVATLSAAKMKKRKEIFAVCFKIWCACSSALVVYLLSVNALFARATLIELGAFAINAIVIAIFLLVTIPIIESIFRIMTNMALMEFIDPTHPLLQRLSLEAPGTYQHSLSIGHIAEYAANAVGANGMLCRVTTLYHDIGKLNNPHYYTENQLLTGKKSFNIHQLLTPIESAYIIKSHILDGKALAKQHNLPKVFIDIILEHHGTTLISFFYHKQLEKMGGNKEDVDENAFRYPGPKPQTKESAIIMLADSVEAASRTLEENTQEAVKNLVDKIAGSKILDGQFDECDLTFDQLAVVKQKLVEIIKATHHLRIKYPEEK